MRSEDSIATEGRNVGQLLPQRMGRPQRHAPELSDFEKCRRIDRTGISAMAPAVAEEAR